MASKALAMKIYYAMFCKIPATTGLNGEIKVPVENKRPGKDAWH